MSMPELLNSRVATFVKDKRELRVHSGFLNGKFPRMVNIESYHTGKVVGFMVIGQDDPLFDQDQWDGEQQIYRPLVKLDNVDILVIHHG